jgi:hypothetical protein
LLFQGITVSQPIHLTLTPDQIEIVLDALEADLDDYVESAQEARGNGDQRDALTFDEEAGRIRALLLTFRDLLPSEAG